MIMTGSLLRRASWITANTNLFPISVQFLLTSVRHLCEHAAKPFEEIPGPKPIPLLGNIWRYIPLFGQYSFKKIHRSYEKMHQQYGSLVKETIIGNNTLVHVFSTEDMLHVYHNSGPYPMRRSHRALAKYRKDRPDVYHHVGLFPSNGEEWNRFRKLFQKLLLHPQSANTYVKALEDITDDFIAGLSTILDAKQEVDLQPELFKWAVECIGMITLNQRLGCFSSGSNEDILRIVKAAHDTHHSIFITETSPFFQYFETPSYYCLAAAQDYLASVVDKYMMDAIRSKSGSSLVEQMLKVPNATSKDVFTMVLDMFLAGIDTTAYTSAFGLYNLAKNQDVQFKLRKETLHYLPHTGDKVGTNINNMTYLQNVVKETLRVNPVSFGNGRVLCNDLILSGYRVPAGSQVILHHQAACFQESNFNNCSKFFPERWTRDEERTQSQKIASAPFGFGARSCIGQRFAQREMLLIFCKMVRNFTIEYHYEDIDSINRLINVPDKPVKLRLIKLSN